MAFTLGGRSVSFHFASDEEVEQFAGQVLSFQTSQQVELDEFMRFLHDMPNVFAQVMARLTNLAAESTATAAHASAVAKAAKRKLAAAKSKRVYRLKSEMLRISETMVPGPRRLKAATSGVLKSLLPLQRQVLQMGGGIALLQRALTAHNYVPTHPRNSPLWRSNTLALTESGVVRLLPRHEDQDEDQSDDGFNDPSASSSGDHASH
jgi:hypothetical protein